MTKPMPCNSAASGSSVPSAPRARRRTATWAPSSSPSRIATKKMMPGGISAFVPSAVIVYAAPVISAAMTTSVSSVERRLRGKW